MRKEIYISAFLTALFLFILFPLYLEGSMPNTETIATIPEEMIRLDLQEEFYTHKGGYRRETVGLGFSILADVTMTIYFHYLHNDYFSGNSELGDSFLRLWIYCGDFADRRLHLGFLTLFRFPTGPNTYSNNTWRHLALGNSELKIGPVMQYDFKNIFLHANVFYVFREHDRQGFYNTIYLNPVESKTYVNLLGLTPWDEDSFLSIEKLKDDYTVVSCAVNTDLIYPFIPFFEIYASHRIGADRGSYSNVHIEGAGLSPFLITAGGRYFFSYSVFMGIFVTYNPIGQKDYFKEIIGFEFNGQF